MNCFVDPGSGSVRTIANEEDEMSGFQRVPVLMDSGASDSTLPTGERSDVPLIETTKSKSGYAYEAAGGHKTLNE